MKVLYYWLTMGPYHLARMKALQSIPEIELHVWEATNRDDHHWDLDYDEIENYKVLLPGRLLDKKTVRDAAGKFFNELKSEDFDIVVNGAGYFHSGMILPVLWLKLTRTKVLLWTESTYRDQYRNRIKEWVKSGVLKLYDGVLAAGQRQLEYLKTLQYPDYRVKEVGNVVDNSFYERREPENPISNGILYVGRLLSIKNIPLLIEAYLKYREKLLAMNHSPEPLYIIGDGPEKSKLESLVVLKNIKGVNFTGILSPDNLLYYYHNSSMLVLPSISEPWGLVVNEAMASGLPVIVSENCGCVPELVRDGVNGYVIESNSVKQLTEKLVSLSRNEEKITMLGNKGKNIIQNYTPQTYAKNCFRFFNQLLSE